MSTHPLEEILHPQSIAVVGASGSGGRGGNFLTSLLELGFKGKIYPVNPKYSEIAGLKAYHSVREIPGSIDYVISTVPAREVPNMLEECSQKGVKAVHLYTARFSETGRQEAIELEQEILKQSRKAGIRLIGPNCMGVYYPRQGISFREDLPKELGTAALASQSGNVAGEICHSASSRGVYFSKAISYGNAIDLNESDYLDYFSQDPETKIILMYVEGVKDGPRFFRSLRQATSVKPVIVIKGGQGKSGARATASHTASLAGSMKIWETAVTQAGAVSAGTLDELVDLAVAFYFLPSIRGRRVGVAGGAGGASVLAADRCEEAGLDVIPLPTEFREELRNKGVPIWDWIGNPADMSIREDDSLSIGDMLQMMDGNQNFDLLIAIMRSHFHRGQQDTSVETYLDEYNLKECNQKPFLAVVTDGSAGITDEDNQTQKLMYQVRGKLIEASIPFYPTIGRAARAAAKLIDYYQKRGQQ